MVAELLLARQRWPWWLPLAVALLALGFTLGQGQQVGVNWGTQLSHPLPGDTVVQMLRSNNVTRVKLFDADPNALRALTKDSSFEVMVGIPNEMLQRLAQSSQAADLWVSQNVSRYVSGRRRANIRYVAVGNEPFLTAYNRSFEGVTLPALQNIQGALARAGLDSQIKATVPLNADVLANSRPPFPSGGIFRPESQALVVSIVQFLSQTGAPFVINIYPFISLHGDPNFPINFAFFEGAANSIVDGSNTYTNVFDASYDLLVAALNAAGYANMAIIVGEVGWPTDGDPNANVENARRFNQGLLQHVLSNRGTPLRPGSPIHFYLFGLIDEDQKSIAPGNFERHWGVFTYDGQAKYFLDMSGRGVANARLVNAQGVQYLPRRWCVLRPGVAVSANSISFACANADCTALSYGGSCNFLTAQENASYAYNNYYQKTNQLPTSCDFQGQAVVTTTDPSIQPCRFIRQIIPPDDSAATIATTARISLLPLLLLLLLAILAV
ncbi:hypothetical protein SELMODRAFT_171231 [Selaginella moellendorffii]|uniref:X8 domain-containing protein n=1 Tax=Selaginella moellendorffii TaxID=88036 RepID=D8RG85_SELML|nr:glucan endo-1,3-beta-glucosidase 5 [Selaginella moellendorffii]EFJ28996.1 hypothetical protein SELMODRAFT_171231 [Selaginella moellendorffii]|eukprot:XP_002969872.1 glucan endo-1,3-beta-glucosidase 5 [Selaginella moellendorffii]